MRHDHSRTHTGGNSCTPTMLTHHLLLMLALALRGTRTVWGFQRRLVSQGNEKKQLSDMATSAPVSSAVGNCCGSADCVGTPTPVFTSVMWVPSIEEGNSGAPASAGLCDLPSPCLPCTRLQHTIAMQPLSFSS